MTQSSLDFLAEGMAQNIGVVAQSRPCFAIPLISSSLVSNTYYLQEVNLEGIVTAFEEWTARGVTIWRVDAPGRVRIGGEQVHAFVDPNGHGVVGTREELSPRVARWISHIDSPVTRLAFSEFCGDEAASLDAAQKAFDLVANESGRDAATTWFANSILFRRLQEAALQSANTPEALLETERALRNVDFSIVNGALTAAVPKRLFAFFTSPEAKASRQLTMAQRLANEVTDFDLSIREHRTAAQSETVLRRGKTAEVPDIHHELSDALAATYAELDANPELVQWARIWREAWRASAHHRAFEDLAIRWARTSSRFADDVSLVLVSLLIGGRDIDVRTLALASDWLTSNDAQQLRWAKVYYRTSNIRPQHASIDAKAIDYLGFSSNTPGSGHKDWVAIWNRFWDSHLFSKDHLADLAIHAISTFGNRAPFARRVILRVIEDEQRKSRYHWDILKWLENTANKGSGWLALVEGLLPDRDLGTPVSDIALNWLATSPSDTGRWSLTWLALHRSGKPGPLHELAIEGFLRAARSNPRLRLVWDEVERSGKGEGDARVALLRSRGWPSILSNRAADLSSPPPN